MEFIKLGKHARNLTGQRFGKLIALGPAKRSENRGQIIWLCRCDCGVEKTVTVQPLVDGRTQSCGCAQREFAKSVGLNNLTHGKTKSPEWSLWSSMRARCCRPSHPLYSAYGGIGIKVSERWQVFENFFEDVGPRPSEKHSLDRYPNQSGNYEPGNVRWATAKEQNQNKANNVVVSFCGKTGSLSSFFEGGSAGGDYDRARRRIASGWPVDLAMTAPSGVRR